jgi:hypothetical protein
MSMCICRSCGAYIDSDFDLDCFVEIDGRDTVRCVRCREEAEEDETHDHPTG